MAELETAKAALYQVGGVGASFHVIYRFLSGKLQK